MMSKLVVLELITLTYYADEPTNTTWYMPDTNAVHNGTSAPAIDLTLGQAV